MSTRLLPAALYTLTCATAWLAISSRSLAATDLIVLRFDGSLTGAAGETPTEATGHSFQAGVSGQGVLLPAPNSLNYASAGNISAREGTFECWVRPTWNGNDGQGHMLVQYGLGGGMLIGKDGANNLRIILNRFGTFPGGEVGVAFNISSWVANQWHYVAFTWSDTTKMLEAYIDGTLSATQSFTSSLPAISSTTFQVGGDGAGSYAQAVLDNLRISDGVRSPAEMAARMQEGLTISGWSLNPATGPSDLWPLWYWWITPTITADTNAGVLTLPAIAASWSSSVPGVAIMESSTGRVHALTPGDATLTGTLGGIQNSLNVHVVTPTQPPVEEPIDPYLATPAGGSLYKIPVLILRYFPTTDGVNLDPALCGSSLALTEMKARAERIEVQHKFMLEEGSRFRGYAFPAASPSLGYQVVKIITVYEDVPPGFAANAAAGIYFPDYNQILGRFGVERLVNELGVKEIWLWQQHFGRIAPNESNMSSPTTGDISNSFRTTGDQPVYGRTFVTYGLNLTRQANEATHNHGHQLESILAHANWRQDGNTTIFWQNFVGRTATGQWQQGRCGDTHHPPNAVADYDYANPTPVSSDIEDWRPDHAGSQTLVDATTWGSIPYPWPGNDPAPDITQAQWYIYWMQAVPGRDNAIPHGANQMTNWWHFTGDWDAAILGGLGLYEAGSCAYSLSAPSQSFSACGGSGSVTVACGDGCRWIASSNEPWISISAGRFGAGNGVVNISVSPNDGPARSGTIAIAGRVFGIDQGAASRPSEVSLLSLSGGATTQLAWAPVSGAELYDVSRGSLTELGPGSYGSCFQNDLPSTATSDSAVPPAATGWFYLVRAVDAETCSAGSYGTDGDGVERVNLDPAACP